MINSRSRFWAGLLAGVSLGTISVLAAQEFDQNLDKSFRASPGGKLVIQADRGSITLDPKDSDQVQIRVLRKVKGGTKAQAYELFADHEVTFQQEGNTFTVVAKNKKNQSGFWRTGQPQLQVSYQVVLPKKFNVDLRASGGDIRSGDLDGAAAIRTTSGSINLKSVTGPVDAADSGGDILVADAGSTVVAHTTSGSIKIEKARGKVEASDSGGDVQIGQAGGDLVASTTSGSIRVATAQGSVEAKDSGGDIRIDTALGDVAAQTTSGSIHLGQVNGKRVKAKNSGGGIDISRAAGSVTAQTTSGAIAIGSAEGGVDAVDSGGDIRIDSAGGPVMAQTTSGSIRLGAMKGESVNVQNSGGNIDIAEAGGSVAARTTSGAIKIQAVQGKLEAHNSGGSIQVKEAHDAVAAETSSGDVSVSFSTVPRSESHLSASGGGIKVALPKSAALDLDARSSGGEVVTDTFVVAGEKKSGSVQGKINGGGPSLILRSSSGDIRLRASAETSHPTELEDPAK
jgi:DUF4097 and DUF4098 domain-containing protein YvlB